MDVDEWNKNTKSQLLNLERKANDFFKSKRVKKLFESDFFKFFILLGIYFLIVIVTLFKTKKENNYISEFIYIYLTRIKNFLTSENI